MTAKIDARLARLERRVLTSLGRGRVTTANDSGPVQMLQVQINELETIDNVPRLAEFGFTSMPPDGSDVGISFIAGDRGNGAVVSTGHQDSRPRGLKAGESMLYSQDGKQVYLTAGGGIVVDANGQDVVVNNARDVTWTLTGKLKFVAPGGVEFDAPNVSSTGDFTDNTATGNTSTMKTMREIHDTHDHDLIEIQTGSSTVTTKVPNQQE